MHCPIHNNNKQIKLFMCIKYKFNVSKALSILQNKCIPLCHTLNYIQLMFLINQLIIKNISFIFCKIKIIHT